jgi:exosortase
MLREMALPNRPVDWLVPGVLWLWLFYRLHDEWTLNTQYNYGWAVPFLAALIFFLRWQRRPNPGAQPARTVLACWLWLILVALLPLRIIEVANPDWRLLGWILALLAVSFTLGSLARVGGREWVRHFAFPVCFPLVSVPWPVRLENAIVQNLMSVVTSCAVEFAGWIGVGAYQVGNVIELRNGFVGVDDACSGVRTLQAGIMVSLILGELLQLRRMRRLALVILGGAWVFACNIFRAAALVVVAARSGAGVLERWHDLIGTLALMIGLAGLLALAWLWKSEGAPLVTRTEAARRGGSRTNPLLAAAWLAAVFGITELWYRSHEGQLVERARWQVRWPQANETLQLLPVAETTRAILHYDEASSAAWEDPGPVRWWSFFARWKPGRSALQLVRSHSPEICLPAIGRVFRGDRPPLSVQAGSVALDFRVYEFDEAGRPLFVFVGIQDDKAGASGAKAGPEEWNAHGRLRAAWTGRRNLGQRLLEIAVTGFDDQGQAREAAAKTVNEIVQLDQPIR